MATLAQGYLAHDGTFFESIVEAELHEADLNLVIALTSMRVDASKFKDILEDDNARKVIQTYIEAYEIHVEAARVRQSSHSDKENTDPYETPTVQQQSDGRHQLVRDMGSSEQPEALSKPSPVDSVGDGRSDAPDVQRSADMAVVPRRREAKARRADR